MSDHHWLRGLRTSRAQPPSFGPGSGYSQPPPTSDVTSDTVTKTFIADSSTFQQNPHGSPTRHRAVHRVSSLLNLNFGLGVAANNSSERWTPSNSATSPPLSPPEPSPRRRYQDNFGPEPDPEAAWHNPNLMQMAESLQAVMICKRDPLAPIPIMYNSYVLRLIEGFADMTKKLREKDEKMAELGNLREKELEQFRGISEEWIQREKDYKAEIKRLELLLVKESKDGVASVTLARHNSLVNRADTKRFQARLSRISSSQDGVQLASSVSTFQPKPESTNLVRAGSCCRITESHPRLVDSTKDVLMSRLVEKDQGPLATAIPVDTPTVRQAGILDVVTQAEQENQSQRPSGESPHIPLTQRNQAPVSSSHGLSNHSSAISPQARSVGSLPPAKQPLKHRYSFIEGDDGLVLTIPHVSAAQESQKKSKLWQKGSSRSDSGLDPLSTSFNSVIWLGADDRHMSLADRGQESASSSVSSETTTQRDLEGATTGEDLTQHPTAALLTPGSKKATVTEVADFGSRSVLFSDGKLGTHTVTVSAVEEKPELEMETTVPLGANMAPLLSLNKPKSPSKSRSVTRLGTGETMSNVARIAAARAVSRADNPHGGSGPLDG